jgi:hypothetical protein
MDGGTMTREEVVTIIGRGRLDDHTIAEIIATGANAAELIEALNWAVQGDALGADTMRAMSGRVSAVYELLTAADEDWSDWEDRR